jgi:hypothetical protein
MGIRFAVIPLMDGFPARLWPASCRSPGAPSFSPFSFPSFEHFPFSDAAALFCG